MTQAPRVPGRDGRKMSKSYDNCIYLAETEDEVNKKVRTMMTDPARKRREDKGNPDVCPVYYHHKLYLEDAKAVETVASECREALRGCVDCKKEMAAELNQFLGPIREQRENWMSRLSEVREILDAGRDKARAVASETLRETMEVMGVWK